jgi:PAS domain S-box-containing protein
MKRLSAKFHLAMGLTSIVTSVILLAVMLDLVPDRKQAVINGRIILAEAIASSSTLFLANEDYASVAENLEFSIKRNPDLVAAGIKRQSDPEPLIFGDSSVVSMDAGNESTDRRVVLPILQNQQTWGEIVLFFERAEGQGWLNYIRHSRFSLIAFAGAICFIMFYLYLGRMLKALNPSQAVPGRVRSALDTLAEALLVIDRKSSVVLANKAFQEITGQSSDDILGKNASSFSWHTGDNHPDDFSDNTKGNRDFPWLVALQKKETLRGEPLWLKSHDGEWHKFLVNCSPIITGKTANGVLISLDDITELEEKEQELRLARDAAEEANHAKTSFLSNMSHEIRTPMTAILGFTEVLKRGTGRSDSNWQKHLNTISSSGKHLLELINDVLDLSKVESGALEIESIKCKPYMVAHDVVQVLNVRAEEKSIGLDIVVPEPLPEHIISDSSRLRQIITNLVGNAIKFTDQGGVQIILRTEQQADKSMLAIDVVDSGIGMNEKQLGAIFKPFVQADSSITRRFGGTGLGLAISKKLAGALGGDITVSSEMNVGTTFTAKVETGSLDGIELLSPDEVKRRMSESEDTHETMQWVFPPSKILVIDDAAENRELITLVLSDLGIESETAEHGAIGVQMAHESQYDIIMSDIQMPVMDGYETAKTLRANGIKQPIIALTANAMKGYEERILNSGFSHYMTKPIDLDALTRLLGDLLGGESTVVTAETQAQAAVAAPPAAVAELPQVPNNATPIYSRMGGSETLGHVVDKFIEKLHLQLPKIEEAYSTRNYAELASLAHWLKGSGGTVGFDALFEPAKDLEVFAGTANDEKIAANIAHIKALAVRLRPGKPTELVEQNQPLAADTETVIHSVQTQGSGTSVVTPVESRLAEKNPAFRPIILRFVSRLDSQINLLEQAIARDDFVEIANLAHWLKGSGGTVGFDVFTEPAAEMELYAKNKNNKHMGILLDQIKVYASNIVVPGNDSGSTDRKDSA